MVANVSLGSIFRFVFITSGVIFFATAIGAVFLCVLDIDPSRSLARSVVDDKVTALHAQEFCGACHVVPRPDLLPRNAWPDEIARGYRRYQESGRHDLKVPDQVVMKEYYTRLASSMVHVPSASESSPSPVEFRSEAIDLPDGFDAPAVSFLNVTHSGSSQNNPASDLLLCDMLSGSVNRFSWNDGKLSNSQIGKLKHPDHIVACSFDGRADQDYLVADLGVLKPSDELQGSVTLFRRSTDGQSLTPITIIAGLGRVADAQLADLDGDGDNDFVVAEFGHQHVGRLLWLETVSTTNGRPETKMHVIDERHGSIHTPVVDLDGDGDLDLVVLISQEHEAIVAFLNDGHGHFERHTLFEADSPSFGSSGLELVDLDQDGDLDILFTNGDTLDTMQIQPFHGVNWLENTGFLKYRFHQLAPLPGAVRAIARDFDGDGDMDVAAVAFCPGLLRFQMRPSVLDTIILLEQKAPGQFERHSLEHSLLGSSAVAVGHMAIAAGDFDGDHDLDLAVGEFSVLNDLPQGVSGKPQKRRWLTIHWNQSKTNGPLNASVLDANISPSTVEIE